MERDTVNQRVRDKASWRSRGCAQLVPSAWSAEEERESSTAKLASRVGLLVCFPEPECWSTRDADEKNSLKMDRSKLGKDN